MIHGSEGGNAPFLARSKNDPQTVDKRVIYLLIANHFEK